MKNKLKSPTIITATYKIITPMFIGDAEQQASTISPQSFKGALRFWWRALAWGRIRQDADNDIDALQALHHQEAVLFGSSANMPEDTGNDERNKIYGKGIIGIKFQNISVSSINKNDLERQFSAHSNSCGYALGQGLVKYQPGHPPRTVYLKNALKPGGTFTVLISAFNIQENQIRDIQNSLLLLGLLGGMGSKSRRGLGSIAITSLTDRELPQNQEELRELLSTINLTGTLGNSPANILIKEGNRSAWQTLKTMSNDMQMFRGWGFSRPREVNNQPPNPHMINGVEADHETFPEKRTDHLLIERYYTCQNNNIPLEFPTSLPFGLPRNYLLSNGGNRQEIKLEPRAIEPRGMKAKRSRRASPVLMHIHQFPNGRFLAIQTIFHQILFPTLDEIVVSHKRHRTFVEKGSIPYTMFSEANNHIFRSYQQYLINNEWSHLTIEDNNER